MATQTDVLTALKRVQDQDNAILTAQKSQENVHRNLCLMLGWSADAQPEIKEVPQPDLSRIDTLDPNADAQTAIDNNYDVNIIQKSRKLRQSGSDRIQSGNFSKCERHSCPFLKNASTTTVLTTRDAIKCSPKPSFR